MIFYSIRTLTGLGGNITGYREMVQGGAALRGWARSDSDTPAMTDSKKKTPLTTLLSLRHHSMGRASRTTARGWYRCHGAAPKVVRGG